MKSTQQSTCRYYLYFSMNSGWFTSSADIITYEMDELMATKLHALYQRRKGRDLFDVWYVADSKPMHEGIGGKSALIAIEDTSVFFKKA